MEEIHNCQEINDKPPSFFFQKGVGTGSKILILGESLGKDSLLHQGRAFYTVSGKIVPTGKKLNEEKPKFETYPRYQLRTQTGGKLYCYNNNVL